MSPLPSPTPLRRAVLRMLFSPAGLLFGFVVLIIITCPGARGEDAMRLLIANEVVPVSTGLSNLDVSVPPSPRSPVIRRSTRLDRPPVSSARSATPSERDAARAPRPATDAESFRYSRSALPLLVDPVLDDTTRNPSVRISPMTGPTVGIRSKLPGDVR